MTVLGAIAIYCTISFTMGALFAALNLRAQRLGLRFDHDAKQDGAELSGAGGGDPFFHVHSTTPGA